METATIDLSRYDLLIKAEQELSKLKAEQKTEKTCPLNDNVNQGKLIESLTIQRDSYIKQYYESESKNLKLKTDIADLIHEIGRAKDFSWFQFREWRNKPITPIKEYPLPFAYWPRMF